MAECQAGQCPSGSLCTRDHRHAHSTLSHQGPADPWLSPISSADPWLFSWPPGPRHSLVFSLPQHLPPSVVHDWIITVLMDESLWREISSACSRTLNTAASATFWDCPQQWETRARSRILEDTTEQFGLLLFAGRSRGCRQQTKWRHLIHYNCW